MNKKKILRYTILGFAGIMMIVIFIFSSQSAAISNKVSEFFTERVFSAFGFSERFVRKAAHFTEFFVLGSLVMIFLSTFDIKHFICALISVVGCTFYAAFDEFHQIFVSGRSGQISDVLLDTCGAVFGVSLVFLILYLISLKNKNQQ
ncbi:MAG: VanZ family protein [Clostridia bacterium]|nr:VanZ family protein [Clostridia bacterium]